MKNPASPPWRLAAAPAAFRGPTSLAAASATLQGQQRGVAEACVASSWRNRAAKQALGEAKVIRRIGATLRDLEQARTADL